jgi:hypothetical protein
VRLAVKEGVTEAVAVRVEVAVMEGVREGVVIGGKPVKTVGWTSVVSGVAVGNS